MYYVTPDWDYLARGSTWIDGATQIFFAYRFLISACKSSDFNDFNQARVKIWILNLISLFDNPDVCIALYDNFYYLVLVLALFQLSAPTTSFITTATETLLSRVLWTRVLVSLLGSSFFQFLVIWLISMIFRLPVLSGMIGEGERSTLHQEMNYQPL